MQMERQMTVLRKKLASTIKTLGKLDRDLGPDERLAADREDPGQLAGCTSMGAGAVGSLPS